MVKSAIGARAISPDHQRRPGRRIPAYRRGIRSQLEISRSVNAADRHAITHDPHRRCGNWDTETWMYSSADRKHEHWKTSARCTNNQGRTHRQLFAGRRQRRTNQGLCDRAPAECQRFAGSPIRGPQTSCIAARSGREMWISNTRRTLEATTTHQQAQLSPFSEDVPGVLRAAGVQLSAPGNFAVQAQELHVRDIRANPGITPGSHQRERHAPATWRFCPFST